MDMITGFSHIYMPVRDVDASVEFYTKTLGFRFLRKYRTSEGAEPSAYVGLGPVLLEVQKAKQPLPGDEGRVELRVGLTVTDLDAVIAELEAKGVTIESRPFEARTFWGRQAVIRDPSGYGISLREWQAPDDPYFEEWKPRHDGVSRIA